MNSPTYYSQDEVPTPPDGVRTSHDDEYLELVPGLFIDPNFTSLSSPLIGSPEQDAAGTNLDPFGAILPETRQDDVLSWAIQPSTLAEPVASTNSASFQPNPTFDLHQLHPSLSQSSNTSGSTPCLPYGTDQPVPFPIIENSDSFLASTSVSLDPQPSSNLDAFPCPPWQQLLNGGVNAQQAESSSDNPSISASLASMYRHMDQSTLSNDESCDYALAMDTTAGCLLQQQHDEMPSVGRVHRIPSTERLEETAPPPISRRILPTNVPLPPPRRGGRCKPLTAEQVQSQKNARRRGVCIRCRKMKITCCGGIPCDACLSPPLQDAVFRQTCTLTLPHVVSEKGKETCTIAFLYPTRDDLIGADHSVAPQLIKCRGYRLLEMVVIGRPGMHLVWKTGRMFLKPLLRFLIQSGPSQD
ncbi:hypothetical protein EDB81DRAFT_927478 [Dactylonectria macrodidyma]|uniref:Uncharacterized protein n=1 Tax=Dactylonectria macrodidyma TaxID=307937 RepID=A0A9P9I7Z1_9HYPO|nr:hypothetical protein EDB81DRAFT_927478 [Dactylonectria macrodidyma]